MSDKRELPDWKKPALFGYVLIVSTFVVLGGWAAFAKLDSAVIAQGVVAVETNRKTVQHLEGGIIKEILVREGQHVERDQELFRLDPTQPQAAHELQRSQLDFALAHEARLIAERDGKDEITFPDELLARAELDHIRLAMRDQVNQFNERRRSLAGQLDILQSRIRQFQNEIAGLRQERVSTRRQIENLEEELGGLRYLLDRNLVSKSRVMALEREKSRLEGVISRSTADEAKAKTGIGEAELQMSQLRQKIMEEVSKEIQDVRQRISDLREKVGVTADVLGRLSIRSPSTGVVQNLKFFTPGGVIRAGEPILDVVPEREPLIILANVAPVDVESVAVGSEAEIRFPAFQTTILPIITGKVISVSRDRLVDEQTKQPYFLARIVADELPHEVRSKLTAGMPAEVIFPTGERTVVDYLVRPLKDRMRVVLREQ